jgi:hypothetical protein
MTAILKGRTLITAMVLLIVGCQNRDAELARLASEGAERQASQSQQVAEASANLTAGAEQLIESAGRSQESLIALQQDLQTEQALVGQQRDLLEQERKTLARERVTTPLVSSAILQVGFLIACLLPLLLAWRVLRLVAVGVPDAELAELLIEDLTREQPRLLRSAGHQDSSAPTERLPGPG